MNLKEAKVIIDYINREDYEPNEWESNFIESILNSKKDCLSDKQANCLNQIYAKATGGGRYAK